MKLREENVERVSVSKDLPHQYKYWNDGLKGRRRTLGSIFHGCLG